jgi:beta-glucanase (GH16 family)
MNHVSFMLYPIVFLLFTTVSVFSQGLPPLIKKSYTMVWNDEFNGKQLDMDKWNHRDLNKKRNVAFVKAENSYLDGKGHCVVTMTKAGDEYHIGQISTMYSYLTRYGYFECRAKVHHEFGPHSAFWIQSPYLAQGGDPSVVGAEIDIFEYIKPDPDKIWQTVHYGGYTQDKHKVTHTTVTVEGLKDKFHTYGLEWLKDEYIFYIDGKETWRTKEGVSQIAEFMILSMECSGWGGDHTKGNFPDEVVFDYVRVYKKKNN